MTTVGVNRVAVVRVTHSNKVEKICKTMKIEERTYFTIFSVLCDSNFSLFLCQAKWVSATGLRICCGTQLQCIITII